VSAPEQAPDPRTATLEYDGDDAGFLWWKNSHPTGYVLGVRSKHPPLLHRVRCPEVDRDRHPGRLKAKGSRQICAETTTALRGWLASELPEAGAVLARCPKCAP
jgi:hypothetical protein